MAQDQFRQIEEEFFRLKGQLSAGRLTQQQFDAALKQLMIQDAQGRYWMIGVWKTGIGTCGNYVARAAWLDDNKKATPFYKPDGQIYELPFSVCQ